MTAAELVAWMEQRGYSANGLAVALSVSERTIWNWRRKGTAGAADRALRALRTPVRKRSKRAKVVV